MLDVNHILVCKSCPCYLSILCMLHVNVHVVCLSCPSISIMSLLYVNFVDLKYQSPCCMSIVFSASLFTSH